MNNEIFEILKQIRNNVDFNSSSNFILDGFLDSFDITVLVAELENKFNFTIDENDIIPEYFTSIDTIIELVNKYK